MKKNPMIVFSEPPKVIIKELDIPVPGLGQVFIKSFRTIISIGTEMTAFYGEFSPDSNWEKFFSKNRMLLKL